MGAFPLPTTGALPLPTYGAGGGIGGGKSAASACVAFTASPDGVFTTLVCITTSAKTVTQPTIKIRFIESPHPNQHSHTQFSARGLVQKGHTVQLIGWLLTRMDGLQERQPPGLS